MDFNEGGTDEELELLVILHVVMQELYLILSMCYIVLHTMLNNYNSNYDGPRLRGPNHFQEQCDHINQLVKTNDIDCLKQLRMDRRCFMVLCNMIKNIGGLGNSKHVTLEEKVALFINILAFDYASVMLSQVEWLMAMLMTFLYVALGLCLCLSFLVSGRVESWVIFDPYKNRRQNVSDIAFYTGPIRAMSYVEPYLPDRVLRQFGLLQRIPADPIAPQRASRGQHTYHVVYEWTEGFWSSPDYHLVPEDKRERTPPGIPWACTDDYIPWLSVFSHQRVGRGLPPVGGLFGRVARSRYGLCWMWYRGLWAIPDLELLSCGRHYRTYMPFYCRHLILKGGGVLGGEVRCWVYDKLVDVSPCSCMRLTCL
ncbi:hypothetical protein RHGRI_017552 [Rhododendron griersonianum]|uniref:DUF8040 domain-containing protein n=1 Tax=Rhododendron griersonianum TaxID=479676 RepID=A0AAV6JY76_9ERIC|nr:hypothetical protein RHGRI_017552 [Rhododendron griersonianum]